MMDLLLKEKDGTYTGYGVEYLRKIAEYTGWEYEFEYDAGISSLKKLETGEIDMICQAQRTKEREKQYHFFGLCHRGGDECSVRE